MNNNVRKIKKVEGKGTLASLLEKNGDNALLLCILIAGLTDILMMIKRRYII
jgi:hypothetical protein